MTHFVLTLAIIWNFDFRLFSLWPPAGRRCCDCPSTAAPSTLIIWLSGSQGRTKELHFKKSKKESESPKTNLKVSNGTKNIFYVLTLKSSFVLVITFEFPFGLGWTWNSLVKYFGFCVNNSACFTNTPKVRPPVVCLLRAQNCRKNHEIPKELSMKRNYVAQNFPVPKNFSKIRILGLRDLWGLTLGFTSGHSDLRGSWDQIWKCGLRVAPTPQQDDAESFSYPENSPIRRSDCLRGFSSTLTKIIFRNYDF